MQCLLDLRLACMCTAAMLCHTDVHLYAVHQYTIEHLFFPHVQGDVSRLAEIIVGFGLGLELSTLAAVASGQFASAHEKLGRNWPTHGLKEEFLNREFFANVLGSRGRLLNWSRMSVSGAVKRAIQHCNMGD